MDWCFGNPSDRLCVDAFFQQLYNLLHDDKTVLYVHCKNGKDRSGGMVYAILRVRFHFTDAEARATLRTRLDNAGEVIRPREYNLDNWKTFIESTFEDLCG